MKNRKTPAFTMIELIVALIVSSILIFFAINFFSSFVHFFNKTLSKNNQYSQILYLNSRLLADFSKADSIKYVDNSLYFFSYSDKTQYKISKNSVNISNQKSFNENMDIVINDIIVNYTQNNLVNYLNLEIKLDKHKYTIILTKDYSKYDLYNYQVNN